MFYSTASSLDRKSSMSSDEEGDIYCHTDVVNCPSSQTEKTADTQVDQDTQDKDIHKPEQVRHTHR